MTLQADDIARAADVLKDVVHRTPLQSSRTIGLAAGSPVWLKAESLQKTGSWKIRGAYTALVRLDAPSRARGVVTFSAGNWGQGVACAAHWLGIGATIVLPAQVNPVKRSAIEGYGARIVVSGRDSQELLATAQDIARDGALLLNPLDNHDVMVGAATLGLELIDQRPDLEAIVVPVGGGALIAGIAAGVKLHRPDIRIFGVQPLGACAVHDSISTGTLVDLEHVDTIADGLAVRRPSATTVARIARTVDEIVLVSDAEIKQAILVLLERAKLIVEPSGAAGVAALLNTRLPSARGLRTAVVLTGGNIDVALLRELLTTGPARN